MSADPLDRFVAWALVTINMRQPVVVEITQHRVIEL